MRAALSRLAATVRALARATPGSEFARAAARRSSRERLAPSATSGGQRRRVPTLMSLSATRSGRRAAIATVAGAGNDAVSAAPRPAWVAASAARLPPLLRRPVGVLDGRCARRRRDPGARPRHHPRPAARRGRLPPSRPARRRPKRRGPPHPPNRRAHRRPPRLDPRRVHLSPRGRAGGPGVRALRPTRTGTRGHREPHPRLRRTLTHRDGPPRRRRRATRGGTQSVARRGGAGRTAAGRNRGGGRGGDASLRLGSALFIVLAKDEE